MIEIMVNDGKTKIRMNGSTQALICDAMAVIESLGRAFNDNDGQIGELFEKTFYAMAEDHVFFRKENHVVKEDKGTPEDKLKNGLVEKGVSNETADSLVDIAQALVKLLDKAAEESSND